MLTSFDQADEDFMRLALSLAQSAEAADEVPVGAVIVSAEGELISTGYNRREEIRSALSHAETEAIGNACRMRKNWRLQGCTLYVTLEPCLMCAGAIYQARIARVVYGASDPKAGALGSLYAIHEDSRLNHNFKVSSGVCKDEAATLLRNFFQRKRSQT